MPAANELLPIEAARPAEAAAIRALLQQAGLPHEDFAAHLANFLVARQDGIVVGAVGFERHGSNALLRSLVVAPAWRGAGLGGRLVGQLAVRARGAGVTRFYLLTTTAEKFFAARGFAQADRMAVPIAVAATPEFQSLCPASAVCLTREISA